ncbi:unnamed protein product [Didymodactylos carnosus]|uniref:Uncharacterized protein n=1 Tax=Didymodactylos carnosus TaxID=1234261 RepID=A0A8S2LWY1_9BILA|nr:unnamed protein product [Didymodactylos carnosus]CAF3921581.1 unnamed protein product [Didymodactylos carnosus]
MVYISTAQILQRKLSMKKSLWDQHLLSMAEDYSTRRNCEKEGKECNDKLFLIQVASVPGSQAGMSYEQSKMLHDILVQRIITNNRSQIQALTKLSIKHEIVLKSGYSYTQKWGFEPNMYIKIEGNEQIAKIISALFGQAFCQDGIGLCYHQNIDSNENGHKIISISNLNNSLFNEQDRKLIIDLIKQNYPCISAQIDTSGQSIEFHDYQNGTCSCCTQVLNKEHVKCILSNYKYNIEERYGKSDVVDQTEYLDVLAGVNFERSLYKALLSLRQEHAHLFSAYNCCPLSEGRKWLLKYMNASHFRGGIITWSIVNSTNATVTINIYQTYSWKKSAVPCDNTIIASQTLIGSGLLSCISSCSTSSGFASLTAATYCTDFSGVGDVSSGKRSDSVTLAIGSYFYAAFSGSAWFAGVGGGSWSITTYINVQLRPDGHINHPPTVAALSVMNIPLNVTRNIALSVWDADNDFLRCRWANSSPVDECASVCSEVPNSTLFADTCTLQFIGLIPSTYYVVALMLEDFYTMNSTTALSSIPLQFLIYVYQSGNCSILPTIVSTQSCVDVQAMVPYSQTLSAQVGCNFNNITDFVSTSPTGMLKSDVYKNSLQSNTYSINLTWTPAINQVGTQIFCTAATDSEFQQSIQYCITFIVSLTSATLCPETTIIQNTTVSAMSTLG